MHMEDFDKRMKEQMRKFNDELFEFENKLQAASTNMKNCFNQFHMLSDVQFIEHVICFFNVRVF
jgi:hypothetical protein